MHLRLANINDLSKLKVMYGKIIDNMAKNNVPIWDEIFILSEYGFEIEVLS